MIQDDRKQGAGQDFGSLIELFQWMKQCGIPEGSPAWHLNYDQYMSAKARLTGTPSFGVLELTPRCNLNCKMCYVHLEQEQMNGRKELSGDAFLSIIDGAVDMGMTQIQLTGGEAMMHPEFDRIFLHCQEKGLLTAVMTNGLLLTRQRIEFFKLHTPTAIQITLYGGDEACYEKVTGLQVFKTVTKNILRAKELSSRLKISVTPNRFCKAQDIEKIVRFCIDNDLKYAINDDLQLPNEDTGRNLDDFNLTEDELVEIKLVLKRMNVSETNENASCDEISLPESGIRQEKRFGIRCGAGRSLFCITWKGAMKPCLDLPVSAQPLEVGFEEAWRTINTAVKKYPIPSECGDCIYAPVCNQCPAIHSQGEQPGRADRRMCRRMKRFIAEGLRKLPVIGGSR